MSPIHLRNAPIREAIVDIQGVTPTASASDALLSRLKAAHAALQSNYPTVEEVVQREIDIVAPSEPKVNALLLGYMLRSSGKPQKVIQFRTNGYTFSWMAPYQDWGNLIQEAKSGWEIYLRTVPDFAVNRVAVRFINQLTVPFPLRDIDQHLLEIPKPFTTPEEYASLRGFAEQRITLDVPTGATVALTRLLQEPQAGAIQTQAIIDIDVYRGVALNPTEANQIWEIFPAFQGVKNRVFYRCIGPAVIKACGGEETA